MRSTRGMFQVQHLNAGARRHGFIVYDDVDRQRLVDQLHARFGESLLAYCIMGTHLHVVVEGDPEKNAATLAALLRAYGQAFLRRHGVEGPFLRGPVHVTVVAGSFELARTIHYVHGNPVPKIASTAIAYEWASTRAFAGLARTPYPNVARALRLLAENGSRVVPADFKLVDPEAAPTGQPLALIVPTSAGVLGVPALELVTGGRAPRVLAARALVAAVGSLEGHTNRATAAALGVSPSRVTQLQACPVGREAVRAARTVLALPALRERLVPLTAHDIVAEAAPD